MPSASEIAAGLLRLEQPALELTQETPSAHALQAPSVAIPTCRSCIHLPCCAFFRETVKALLPFAPAKGAAPVEPYGLATSCQLFRSS